MSEALIEGTIIALIVGAMFFMAGRSLYRTLRGKPPGCQCCGDKGCSNRLDAMKSCGSNEIFPLKREGGK
jgi:hypothetical protein